MNSFQNEIKKDGIQIVQFGSSSCQPCIAIKQRIDMWCESHKGTDAMYVSVEKHADIAAQEGIFSVPTVLVYVNGQFALRESGYFSLDILLEKAERYLALLM